MLRITTALAACILTLGPAAAELPAADESSRSAAPVPITAPTDDGAALGARLSAVGQLRPLGDDFDLAVRDLFTEDGAASFLRWRTLADTLSAAADGLPRHRIVVVARAPHQGASAVDEARVRATALVDALVTRGVDAARIQTVVAPRDPSGIELQIRFERVLVQPPANG